MMTQTNDLLTRRVAKILPESDSLGKLLTTRKIRLYQGFDPTGGRLHLGHTIGLRKLMEFARAGHEVIMLFGTGTVLVGDPSLRDTARKIISQDEIDENIKNWKKQVEHIVDFDLVTIKQNGDWLTKMTLKDIIGVASNISAIQLFKRDNFTRRLGRGDTVWYHETMYPMLQGYDSVVMDVDLEVGGTDQEFNMLVGRELQKKMNNKEKFVLETPMILGTDGKTMSKTSGNCIFLDSTPEEMYGKLMEVQDDLITTYFELLTDLPMAEIAALDPSKPIENKMKLAYEITRQFSGDAGAKAGELYFTTTIQTKTAPEDTPETAILSGESASAVLAYNLFPTLSHSEIKRIIKQGGYRVNNVVVTDPEQIIRHDNLIVQLGKKTFAKTKLKE